MKLNGLPGAGERSDGDRSGFGIGTQQIANEKIATLEFIEILVHHQADEKIPSSLFLNVRAQLFDGFIQDLIGRSVADLEDHIAVGLGDGPCVPDRCAPLRNHAGNLHASSDRNRDPPFRQHFFIEVNLGLTGGIVAAGHSAQNGKAFVSIVPLAQPGLCIHAEGIRKDQPGVQRVRSSVRFQMPIAGTIPLLDLVLGEADGRQTRVRERVKAEADS